MHKRRVPVSLWQRGVDVLLGGGVGPEIDGARGCHAHDVGAQALVQAAHALCALDVPGNTLDLKKNVCSTFSSRSTKSRILIEQGIDI